MKPQSDDDTLQKLLVESRWLHGLALDLVSDATLAEDVTQDTLLAAVSSPPERLRSARAWLATVLRRKITARRAQDAARRKRETGHAHDEALVGTDELQAQAELQARLHALISELPPELRRTLILRYFGDLPPREIALREGVRVDVIKSRIARAKSVLRRRFDDRHGVPCLPLLVGAALPKPASLLATTSLSFGSLIMKKFVIATIAILALSWGYVLLKGEPEKAGHDDHNVPSRTEESVGEARRTSVRGEAKTKGATLPPKAAPTFAPDVSLPAIPMSAKPLALRGRIRAEDGRPLVGVKVTMQVAEAMNTELVFDGLALEANKWRERDLRHATSDTEGRFQFPKERAQPFHLIAAAEGHRLATAWNVDPQKRAIELIAQPAHDVTLRIVDDEGTALTDVDVAVIVFSPRLIMQIYQRRRSDSAGEIRLSAPRGRDLYFIQMRKAGHLTTPIPPITSGTTGQTITATLSQGRRLEFALERRDGEPVQDGLRVGLSRGRDLAPEVSRAKDGLVVFEHAPTDKILFVRVLDEAFTIQETKQLGALGAFARSSRIRLGHRIDAPIGSASRIPLTLIKNNDLVGRVLDDSGEAVPNLALVVRPAIGDLRSMKIGTSRGITDGDGRFRITHVPAGPRHVMSESRAWQIFDPKNDDSGGAVEFTMSSEGSVHEQSFTARRTHRFHGQVVDDQGEPLAGALVTAYRAFAPDRQIQTAPALIFAELSPPTARCDASGRFVLDGVLPDDEFRIVAHGLRRPGGWSEIIDPQVFDHDEAIIITMQGAISVHLDFKNSSGEAVANLAVTVKGHDVLQSSSAFLIDRHIDRAQIHRERRFVTDEQGGIDFDIPAGLFTLARADDQSPFTLAASSREFQATLSTRRFEVKVEKAPSFQVRFVDEDGKPIAAAEVLFLAARDQKVLPGRHWIRKTTDSSGQISFTTPDPNDLKIRSLTRTTHRGIRQSFEIEKNAFLTPGDKEREFVAVINSKN